MDIRPLRKVLWTELFPPDNSEPRDKLICGHYKQSPRDNDGNVMKRKQRRCNDCVKLLKQMENIEMNR